MKANQKNEEEIQIDGADSGKRRQGQGRRKKQTNATHGRNANFPSNKEGRVEHQHYCICPQASFQILS